MMTGTYSPQDNKLRLYASARLSAEDYAVVKEAGFKWAPKQECFIAPMWTPQREDTLLKFVDLIEDEDSTTEERAAERAERFEGYREKRTADAEAAHAYVERITDGIPMGQPILIGHHSERRARKDAERIESGMRKVIRNWETAEYWQYRAKASIAHARYKELPAVRNRRIKGLEADKRGYERDLNQFMDWLAHFQKDLTEAEALTILNQPGFPYGCWSDLRDGKKTVEQIKTDICHAANRNLKHTKRWLNHINNRIAYERAMLGNWEPPKVVRAKRELSPLVNFPSEGCVEMTATHWKNKSRCSEGWYVKAYEADGKQAEWRKPGAYRRRVESIGFCKPPVPVFITDMGIKYPEGYEAPKAGPEITEQQTLGGIA